MTHAGGCDARHSLSTPCNTALREWIQRKDEELKKIPRVCRRCRSPESVTLWYCPNCHGCEFVKDNRVTEDEELGGGKEGEE